MISRLDRIVAKQADMFVEVMSELGFLQRLALLLFPKTFCRECKKQSKEYLIKGKW